MKRGRARGKWQPLLPILTMRLKAATELLPQLYAVDVDQPEDLAHEFAAEPSMPTSLAVELAHLRRCIAVAGDQHFRGVGCLSVHVCAPADPAGACIWSHRGPRARPSLLMRVLSRPRPRPYSEKWSSGPTVPGTGDSDCPPTDRPGHSTAGRRTRAENLERLAGDSGRWRIQISKIPPEDRLG